MQLYSQYQYDLRKRFLLTVICCPLCHWFEVSHEEDVSQVCSGMKGCFVSWLPIILILLLIDVIIETQSGSVAYQYKKYTYRKKRDDKTYKNLKQPCEINPDCLAKQGAEQAICIRRCISDFCYVDIYGEDPLEEGEIDVRLNSFKGCCAQQRK